MRTPRLTSLLLSTLIAGSAHAGVLDLATQMGNANIFTMRDFRAESSDVEGALIAGGSVNISSYSVNWEKKAAFTDGYALVVRNDLTLKGGSINHGLAYVGGNTSLTWAAAPATSATSPIDFDATAAYFNAASANLAKVSGTGSVTSKWSGVVLAGAGSGTLDIFNVDSSVFANSSHWMLENLTAGQTLIFNVGGASGTFNNGGISFEPLSKFNVLFNFYEATELDVRGIIGSVLAPKATVTKDWGVINGAVIVDNWDSTVQINANHYFKPIDIAGYEVPVLDKPDLPSGEVPEPGSLTLGAAGLIAALLVRRRNRKLRGAATKRSHPFAR